MSTLKDFLPPPIDNIPPPSPPLSSTTLVAHPSPPSTSPASNANSNSHSNANVLPLARDALGAPDFSAIVRQGSNATRTVHTSVATLIEKPRHLVLHPAPSDAAIDATTARTRAALQHVVQGKISAAHTRKPDALVAAAEAAPHFVRYTPANTNTNAAPGGTRIIKMVQAQVDPMLPPRFAQRKAPVNPPSPPVPVMHSPERKLGREEAADWKIPPVVSNWKNNRGYTIALDKRLAADGRAHQQHPLNDRFAAVAEALYKAERDARDDVEKRAQLQRSVALRAKEKKERELRELAERARQERKGYLGLADTTDGESDAGGGRVTTPDVGAAEAAARRATDEWLHAPPSATAAAAAAAHPRPVLDDAPPVMPSAAAVTTSASDASVVHGPPRRARRSRFADAGSTIRRTGNVVTGEGETVLTPEEVEGVRERERIRRERREMREREIRGREARGDESTAPTLKRSKLSRDQDRDLAERVALGQGAGGAGRGGGANGMEVQYDQRLFNRGAGGGVGGLAGGFGADDAYSLYERPLFAGAEGKGRYRPPKEAREGTAASKEAEAGEGNGEGRSDRPVEFERDSELKSAANEDPYGLDKFFDEAKRFEGGKGREEGK